MIPITSSLTSCVSPMSRTRDTVTWHSQLPHFTKVTTADTHRHRGRWPTGSGCSEGWPCSWTSLRQRWWYSWSAETGWVSPLAWPFELPLTPWPFQRCTKRFQIVELRYRTPEAHAEEQFFFFFFKSTESSRLRVHPLSNVEYDEWGQSNITVPGLHGFRAISIEP